MLFILQRLEADLQFSVFDGICFSGGKSETESWGQSTLDHFPLEKFIVLVWAQGQKEYKIVNESNHNIVLEKHSPKIYTSRRTDLYSIRI